jgi:hypothetical protein
MSDRVPLSDMLIGEIAIWEMREHNAVIKGRADGAIIPGGLDIEPDELVVRTRADDVHVATIDCDWPMNEINRALLDSLDKAERMLADL